MLRILDANDQKYNQSKIESERNHLSNDEQCMLYNVLTKYELLLGIWKIKPVDIELHPEDKTYHSNHTCRHSHKNTSSKNNYKGFVN